MSLHSTIKKNCVNYIYSRTQFQPPSIFIFIVRIQKYNSITLSHFHLLFRVQVAKILLEDCNVDPDCVDYEGWTPIHAAALWRQKEATVLLLKSGADAYIKNISVSQFSS